MVYISTESMVVQPISEEELERRRRVVRELMEKKGIDLLLVYGDRLYTGGWIRYFTNYQVDMFPEYLLLPLEGDIVFIPHYPRTEASKPRFESFGIKDVRGVGANPFVFYSFEPDAKHVVKVISEMVKERSLRIKTIGLVGYGNIPASFYQPFFEGIRREITGIAVQDATDLVEEVRLIKSEEEMKLVEQSASMIDAAWEVALKAIRPGRKECEIMLDIDRVMRQEGSEEQFYGLASAPPDVPIVWRPYNLWNRAVRKGDILIFLLECSGKGGYFTELARYACLGKVPSWLEEGWELAKEVQLKIANELKPNTDVTEICSEVTAEFKNIGFVGAGYGHGQGLNVVEKPFILPGETIKIRANMTFAIHPSIISSGYPVYICDNFVVTETGARRLHRTPQEVFVVR